MRCGASIEASAWPEAVLPSLLSAASNVAVAGVARTSRGVVGVESLTSFNLIASRFFSSVRRKTLIVVRNDLFGLQSSAATGLCSQTGQDDGSVDWPVLISVLAEGVGTDL